MDDLAAFITARLGEDEAMANAAARYWHGISVESATRAEADHVARHDPARALREVTAKRAILANCAEELDADPEREHASEYNEGFAAAGVAMARALLRDVAAIWSDHPAYRPEWAPSPRDT